MVKTVAFDVDKNCLVNAEGMVIQGKKMGRFDYFEARAKDVLTIKIADLTEAFSDGRLKEPELVVDHEMRAGSDRFRLWEDYYSLKDGVLTQCVEAGNFSEITEAELRSLIEPFVASAKITILSIQKISGDFMISGWRVVMIPNPEARIAELTSVSNVIRTYVQDALDPCTISGVLGLLSAGRPEILIGEAESEWLEIKKTGYGFENVNQKHEFALDVAALANSELGGVIVIGLKTSKDSAGQDRIVRVVGCTPGSLTPDVYHAVVSSRVVPSIVGLEISLTGWRDRHILSVHIPSQPEFLKPFIVRGGILESNKLSGAAVTIPCRSGSARWNMSVEAIQSMLASARASTRRNGIDGRIK